MKIEDVAILINSGQTSKEEFIEILSVLKKERQSLKVNDKHIIYVALTQENIPFIHAFNEVYTNYLHYDTNIRHLNTRPDSAYSTIDNVLGKKNDKLENATYELIKNDFFVSRTYNRESFYEQNTSYVNVNAKFDNYVFSGVKHKNIDLILPFISNMTVYNKNSSSNSFTKLFLSLLMKKATFDQFEYIIERFMDYNFFIENTKYSAILKKNIKSIQENLFADQNVLYAFHLIVSGSLNKNNTNDQIQKMNFMIKQNPAIISKLFEAENEYRTVTDINNYMSKSKTLNNPVLNLAIFKGQEPVIDWFIQKGYKLSEDEKIKIASNEKVLIPLKEKHPEIFDSLKNDSLSAILPVFESYFSKKLKTNTKNLDSLLSKMGDTDKKNLFEKYKDKTPLYYYLMKNAPSSLDDEGMNCVDFAILTYQIESVLVLHKHNFPFNSVQRLKIGSNISRLVDENDLCLDIDTVKKQLVNFLNSLQTEEQKVIFQSNKPCSLMTDDIKDIVKNIDFSKEEILALLDREDFICDYLLLHNDYQDCPKDKIVKGLVDYYSSKAKIKTLQYRSIMMTQTLKENIEYLVKYDPSCADKLTAGFKGTNDELVIFIEKLSLNNAVDHEKISAKNVKRI